MFYPLIAFVGAVVRDVYNDMGMNVTHDAYKLNNSPSIVINIHNLISGESTWISWDASLFYNAMGATSFKKVGLV